MTILLSVVAVAIGVFVACFLIEWRRIEAFKTSFPPISDEEFAVRCARGIDSLAMRVRKIVAEVLNIERLQIYPSSRLMKDLGAE